MSQPAICQGAIRVGHLCDRAQLYGILNTHYDCHLPDQAALSGMLNTIYDLHLPLLMVECIDEPET
jgi:hypothetical protein